MVLNRVSHLFKISLIGSFEGGNSILTLKYTTNLKVKITKTSACLSLPVVLPEHLYVAVETLSLLDTGLGVFYGNGR